MSVLILLGLGYQNISGLIAIVVWTPVQCMWQGIGRESDPDSTSDFHFMFRGLSAIWLVGGLAPRLMKIPPGLESIVKSAPIDT